MEIHFAVMYPMLVNFLGFYGACAEMGIDTSLVGKFLQGEETKIMELDRELYGLAIKARRAGLSEVFADHEPARLRAALSAHGGSASQWLTDFDDFLAVYGHRQDATCDVGLPSWIEDNTNPLGMVKTFLLKEDRPRLRGGRAQRPGRARRRDRHRPLRADHARSRPCSTAAWPPTRPRTSRGGRTTTTSTSTSRSCCRCGTPARSWPAGSAPTTATTCSTCSGPSCSTWPAGKPYAGELKSLVADRRQYFDHWHVRRGEMPKVLGTIPESVEDPVLIEIFGINPGSLRAVQNPDAASQTTLTGVAAARGQATGIARVLQSSDELHRLAPGEILVCESTSPNWTPAFGKIAAAVCDGGGMLSHAAIVGREYGVPTVTAVGVATHRHRRRRPDRGGRHQRQGHHPEAGGGAGCAG